MTKLKFKMDIGEYMKLGNDLMIVDGLGDLHCVAGGGMDMGRFTKIKVVQVVCGLLDYLGYDSLEGFASDGLKAINFTSEGLVVVADGDKYREIEDFLTELEQVLDRDIGFDTTSEWLEKRVWVEFT